MAKSSLQIFSLARVGVLALALCSGASQPAQAQDEDSPAPSPFWFNQYSLIQGPSLTRPSAYQPDFSGAPDRSRPVAVRNFTTLGIDLNDTQGIAGTLSWAALAGDRGGFLLRDPSLRAYESSLIETGIFRWHGDVRLHFGVGPESRQADRLFSIQTFNALTLYDPDVRLWGGLWLSARWSQFGAQGVGPYWEFYIAPNLQYQAGRKATLTLAIEENSGLWAYENTPTYYSADPWYVEAAIEWQVTPTLEISPALSYPLSSEARAASLSGSLGISWTLL
jgi:hypothetical protein